jgi:hypothetical protein
MTQFMNKLYFFILTVFLVACSSTEKVVQENVKLERKKTNDLIAVLDSISSIRPNFFYAKMSTSFQDTNSNLKFKTSLRMVKDSAMNLLFTYAKIPVANAIISTDSLTIVNKKNKCFINEDLGYIKETFGIDFVYQNLEELFLGLPIDFSLDQKYFQIHESNFYVISSHRKHKIKRTEKKDKKDKDKDDKDDILIKYLIDANGKELNGLRISSPSDSTEIYVDYLSKQIEKNIQVPKDVKIKVTTPRNVINVDLQYDKVEIDEPQPLILVIPEGYEQCK